MRAPQRQARPLQRGWPRRRALQVGWPAKGVPLTLAALHTGIKGSDAPTGAQLAAICTRAQSEIGAGALPGYKVDAASPYAEGIYALYYGRDAPQGVTYVAECWIGVAASA